MLSSRLPNPENISQDKQKELAAFTDTLNKIFYDALKDFEEEKKRMNHLHGFQRVLNPDFRVPFASNSIIEETKTETIKMFDALKKDSSKGRKHLFTGNGKSNTLIDPLKPSLVNKRKHVSEESEEADVIENTSYSNPLSTRTNKKLKLTTIKAKDIPNSVSQYSFRNDVVNPLEKTFANKFLEANAVSDNTQTEAEALNAVLESLEANYQEKVTKQKEQKQKDEEDKKKEHELKLIRSRIEQANKPRSRFESKGTGSRFEGHSQNNKISTTGDSDSE